MLVVNYDQAAFSRDYINNHLNVFEESLTIFQI